jgi:glycosyltransferase involved in cell wall biosynthesis
LTAMMDSAMAPPPTATAPSAQGRRLLICSAGVPHQSKGASVVLYYYYIARLKRDGYVVRHLLLLEGDAWTDADVAIYRDELGAAGGFDVVPIRSRRLYSSGRLSQAFDRRVASSVRRQAEEFAPDGILCFDFLAAWLLDGVTAAPRIVWLGDLNFETFWQHALYESRENWRRAIHLPSMWLSCMAWKRLYARVLGNASQIVVAARSSETALSRLGIAAEYEPYPWPTEALSPRIAALPSVPSFLFFGQLTGLGSRSAFHFLIEKVFPLLRRQWGAGGFRILLAGRGSPPDWALAAIAGKQEIEQLGFVEDLAAMLAACHAVLAPIDVPVGNRSRIVTAMALRGLVVAHANTALGNPDLVDGETCYLARDAVDFASAMAKAVDDPIRRDAIVDRASRCYRDRFHPERATAGLARRIETLLAGATTSTARVTP